MTRTNKATTRTWIIEGLKKLGGQVEFEELVAFLEESNADEFSTEDHLPQKGHPKDSQFKYMCRWGVTSLRGEGILKRGSLRGWVEFANEPGQANHLLNYDKVKRSPQRSVDQIKKDEHTFVGSKPYDWTITLDGKPISPRTWQDFLIEVAAWVGAEKLINIIYKKRGKWPIIVDDGGPNPKKYAEVPGTPYWVYIYANTDLIVRLAQYLLTETGYDINVLQIKDPSGKSFVHFKFTVNKPRQPKQPRKEATATEKHHKVLEHLYRFGEIIHSEKEKIGVYEEDITHWLDSLLIARPDTLVVSPLFLWASEGDPTPQQFTTRLAIQMTGDSLNRIVREPIPALENYIWDHFGRWRIPQPHSGNAKWHGYLNLPFTDPAGHSASEKLDLFAQLPPEVIAELVRDTEFLSDQQEWSAQAANKGIGPLSRQIKIGIRRPLFLSNYRLIIEEEGDLALQNHIEVEILKRSYVVAGLPVCTSDEYHKNLRFSKDEVAERLLEHPLYASIIQFEVHRMGANLSGDPFATLQLDLNGTYCVYVDGNNRKPLWLAIRNLLEELEFWPVTKYVADSCWEAAVQSAVINLETIEVLHSQKGKICLSDDFASKIKAHPGHSQHRGEKAFRIRLLKYLQSIKEKDA